MTTKTLSQQLCELCGIEPRYVHYADYEWHETDEQTYLQLKEISENYVNIEYPDFEKPENFVRLFNLVIDDPVTITDIIKDTCYYNNTKTYLKALILYLAKRRKCSEYKSKVKQAIKQAEWEY